MNHETSASTQPKKSGGKRGLIIGLAVASLLIVAATVLLVIIFTQKPSQPTDTSGTAEETEQPTVPGELRFIATESSAVNYGTTALYDACALLTIEDLKSQNLQLKSVIHTYVDANVPAAEALPDGNFDSSSCNWSVNGVNELSLDITQPPFNEDIDMAYHQITTTETYEEAGAQVQFGVDSSERSAAIIQKPGVGAALKGTLPADTLKKIISLVVKRLEAAPIAPVQASFAKPYDVTPDPCNLFTQADYKQATGRINHQATLFASHSPSEDDGFEYTRATCRRQSFEASPTHPAVAIYGFDRQEVHVGVRGFASEEKASEYFSRVSGLPATVPSGIEAAGKKAVINTDRAGELNIILQKGKVLLDIRGRLGAEPFADAASLERGLGTLAQAVAGRLP